MIKLNTMKIYQLFNYFHEIPLYQLCLCLFWWLWCSNFFCNLYLYLTQKWILDLKGEFTICQVKGLLKMLKIVDVYYFHYVGHYMLDLNIKVERLSICYYCVIFQFIPTILVPTFFNFLHFNFIQHMLRLKMTKVIKNYYSHYSNLYDFLA